MSDLYTRVAAAALGIPETEVTKEQRVTAKNVAFVSMYRYAPDRTEEELFKELVDAVRPVLKK